MSAAPPTDRDGLRTLHRAFLAAVTYETIAIALGEAGPYDEQAAVRRIVSGLGGYCFELNGALALLLTELGFRVERRGARVGPYGADGATTHVVLVVDLGGERLLVDAGLGESPTEPIPLRSGVHRAGEFDWRVEELAGDRWWIGSHAWGSIPGFEVDGAAASGAHLAERHRWLSTDPASKFVRTLVLQRSYDDRIVTLRRRTLTTKGPGVGEERLIDGPGDLGDTLRERFGIELDADRVERLWERIAAQHTAWEEAGRPGFERTPAA